MQKKSLIIISISTLLQIELGLDRIFIQKSVTLVALFSF